MSAQVFGNDTFLIGLHVSEHWIAGQGVVVRVGDRYVHACVYWNVWNSRIPPLFVVFDRSNYIPSAQPILFLPSVWLSGLLTAGSVWYLWTSSLLSKCFPASFPLFSAFRESRLFRPITAVLDR